MLNYTKKVFFAFIFIVLPSFLYSTIINIPADYATIQAGINASVNTDTLLVQPGTYVENINFGGKRIILASLFGHTQDEAYISSTIIDGNSSGSVVTFNNGEDSSVILYGFTITNGSATYGGGIYCDQTSPILSNLIVTGNTATNRGGGISCFFANPTLENITVVDNISLGDGGGIFCDDSRPSLKNITISNNSATDYGGGICCSYGSDITMYNVTIADNSAGISGGGIRCYFEADPILENSILWNNSPDQISVDNATIVVTYSDIEGSWAGTGNIDSDPLFVDAGNGDYHLTETSPCINTGDPASPLDPDGSIVEMGAYYYQYFGPVWHISKTGSDVTGNGSETLPFTTIQHGINTSVDADTVLVQPGTYVENINFNGKNIVVGSLILTTQDTSYRDSTTINGNGSGRVVIFESGEDSSTLLSGFTISGGHVNNVGGGIFCDNSSPNLEYLVIRYNYGLVGGGGIFCNSNSSMSIKNTIISDNTSGLVGIFDDAVGGGIACGSSDLSLENVVIAGNSLYGFGGGLSGNPNLQNVTISGNAAIGRSGGGIYGDPSLTNSVVWGNSPESISGSAIATYSDIEGGWAGTGNIDSDPLFIDGYHLQQHSPCIDSGDPASVLDPDGTRADMGAYYYDQILNPIPLRANFSASITNGGVPLTVNFTDLSGYGTGVIDEWYWDFGDGNNSSLQNPSHEYLLKGNYTVSLTVTDSNDSTDTKIKVDHITVIVQPPSADFSANLTNGNLPLAVDFTDISTQGTGVIDEWYWDFGDGNNSPIQNPSHEYLFPGVYTVSLTVTDVYDSTDTETKTDYITVKPATWHISKTGSDETGNGSEEFPFATIQHGINTSVDRDTVLVHQGTYVENINYNGKLITLGSLFLTTQDTTYISTTVIDGDNLASVVTLISNEDSTAVLKGFTIVNGRGSYGGGIYCDNSSPNLVNLTVQSNTATSGGGGIYCEDSDPNLVNVTIQSNTAPYGGGFWCGYSSTPSLREVIITNNTATSGGGGINSGSSSNPTLEKVTISGNTAPKGGGISCNSSTPSLKEVTIANNTGSTYGGGIYCDNSSSPTLEKVTISGNTSMLGGGIYCDNSSSPSLKEVIITNNSVNSTGGGIYCNNLSNPILLNSIVWNNIPDSQYEISDSLLVTYSDIQGGYTGTGNIDSDPLFLDPANGNYHLQPASPCIDAGDPSSLLDPDGTIADMGAYYYDQVNPPLIAAFNSDVVLGYYPFMVNFTDLSQQGLGVIEWYWDFGDGNNSILQNPSHEYLPGIYTVSLTVTDINDSTDTETRVNYITVYSTDPPASPTDLQIDIMGDDAIITWAVVDTSFTGYMIEGVDAYLVYYSEIPDQDSLFFFHGLTTETTYTHPYVVQFSNFMFYQVTSFVGELKSLQNWIAEHPIFIKRELDAFIEEKRKR